MVTWHVTEKLLFPTTVPRADNIVAWELELELELYFYLNTVNLSDKILIIKITIYFTLYKHDLKISIVKIEKILLYIDAVCILSIQTKKSRQPFRKD